MTLASLGWDDAWQAAARVADPDGAWTPVRVAGEHRGAYRAIGAEGGTGWIELAGRTFHNATDKRALPTVGDWVLVEQWDRAVAAKGAATVRAQLPRRTFLVRRAAGEATVPQPLAANVDVGIAMTSANTDLNIARLDRYLGLFRDGGIDPILVVSKIDVATDLAQRLAALAPLGARIIAASAVSGAGLDEIRALAGIGKTCVLLGSSGIGKSTLLNAMIGTAQLTRAIRADERGRHTTTRRELFLAPDGSLWIDTPGMRELAQWAEDEEAPVFTDIAELAAKCKYRDCRHVNEPGCAVRAAVPAERLASFHKLAAERKTGAARQSQAARFAEARRAKKKAPPTTED